MLLLLCFFLLGFLTAEEFIPKAEQEGKGFRKRREKMHNILFAMLQILFAMLQTFMY